ncbi:MAG: hypothetical protein KGY56_10935 [Desulfobacterales bacterium]|nr:hypothetical protein [Desulfobacterales bacterium]
MKPVINKIWLVCFLLTLFLLPAESGASEKWSGLMAAGDEGRVILRWVWPKGGLFCPDFYIYRRGEADSQWRLVTPEPITKIGDRQRAEKILGEERFQKYERFIFPDIPDPKKDPGKFRKTVRMMDEIWSMTMLVADMHPDVADLLGVRYVDDNVKPGGKYIYKLVRLDKEQETMVGLSRPVVAEKQTISPPANFKGSAGDGQVFHRWLTETRFSSYDLLRAEKRHGDYTKINTAPIVILKSYDEEGNPRYPEWFYADEDLENGKPYFYIVRGRDPFGRISEQSNPLRLMPEDMTPPRPPLRFATDVTKDTVKLTWRKSAEKDTAGYNIYRSLDYKEGFEKINSELLPAESTAYKDTNLPIGKNWWYYATAVDKNGNESGRSYTALANVRDYIPPAPPQGISGKSEKAKAILSWQANTEEDLKGYRVYQSMQKDADYYHLIDQEADPETGRTVTLPETASASPYFFKITAVDRAGNESDFSKTVKLRLPDVTPPYPPVFKNFDAEEGAIRISWHPGADPDLAGYNLYREKRGDQQQAVQLNRQLLSPDITEFTDRQDLTPGTRYLYSLEAVDRTGNASRRSRPLTASTYDQTPPTPPGDLSAAAVAGEGIRITWTIPGDTDIQAVVVYRAKQENGPFYPLSGISGEPVFLDAETIPGVTYYYRACAVDAAQNRSAYSQTVEALLAQKE